MTPFLLTFTIPHLNSSRNLDAAEILGENAVAFDNFSLKCYLRKKMWFRVRISESYDKKKFEQGRILGMLRISELPRNKTNITEGLAVI